MKTRTWFLVGALVCMIVAEVNVIWGWPDTDHRAWLIAGLILFLANRIETERQP